MPRTSRRSTRATTSTFRSRRCDTYAAPLREGPPIAKGDLDDERSAAANEGDHKTLREHEGS
ncbi:hypothetical protein AGR7B_pAt0302 [Agrobacterium deltaense RV3]|nr:hypothetical protein AGR7B_pAt0302 [Agrobacterium deltaense RV3]